MVDCLILGGTIVDGTGRPPYRSDLAIDGDRIQILRDAAMPQAKRIVPAEGLAVAPGFIDIHSHNDLVAVMGARLNDKVSQGVTTEIFGNCGFSAFPVTSRNAHLTPDLTSLIAPRKLDVEQGIGWPDWASFRAAVLDAGCQANVVGQVGHMMLRSAVMGMALRLPTAEELTEMEVLLARCLKQGASGLSFGLMYHPSSYAEEAEIQSLCQVAAEHDAVVSVHLRGYDVSTLISSMDELISIAETTGVRLQLSHLSPTGRDAQGLAEIMLDAIDRAISRGIDVALDRYPYEQGMSRLGLIFPKWVVCIASLNRIPEAVFIWVCCCEFPGVAAVGGFVEAGLVAGAAGHDDGGVGVEGLDAAEVELLCAGGDGAGLPDVSAVFGAEDRAVGAGGPGDSVADVVDAAEVGGGVGGLEGELGVR